MPNQYKPLPPDETVREPLEYYFNLGKNDKQIAEYLKEHYDTSLYGVSARSVKRLRQKFDLKSARQQRHTSASIAEAIREIRELYPARGAEAIRNQLRIEYHICASRKLISDHLKVTEPAAVQERRARRFKRRIFYAAGVNDIWGMDQHDKWGPRFGLWLHNCIDPMIGYNNWMKVWWTNKNPRLIASYYIEAVRKYGAIPLTFQSDPGSENFIVANMHTRARHKLDPSLEGTLQHRWKRGKMNTKNEVNWSVFRRDCAPGYEDLFEHGKLNGWYDPEDRLENLVFRWIAIPWLQHELDKWVRQRNKVQRRSNKRSILPHDVPELLRNHPEKYGLIDFKIPVTQDFIDELEQEYVPRDHAVFQLTPPTFHERAKEIYDSMGSPPVTKHSFWEVYNIMLQSFRMLQMTEDGQFMVAVLANDARVREMVLAEQIPLVEGLADLRANGTVVGAHGGVPAEDALDDGREYAEFTDDEFTDDGWGEIDSDSEGQVELELTQGLDEPLESE